MTYEQTFPWRRSPLYYNSSMLCTVLSRSTGQVCCYVNFSLFFFVQYLNYVSKHILSDVCSSQTLDIYQSFSLRSFIFILLFCDVKMIVIIHKQNNYVDTVTFKIFNLCKFHIIKTKVQQGNLFFQAMRYIEQRKADERNACNHILRV